jgi:hypothetical protein
LAGTLAACLTKVQGDGKRGEAMRITSAPSRNDCATTGRSRRGLGAYDLAASALATRASSAYQPVAFEFDCVGEPRPPGIGPRSCITARRVEELSAICSDER